MKPPTHSPAPFAELSTELSTGLLALAASASSGRTGRIVGAVCDRAIVGVGEVTLGPVAVVGAGELVTVVVTGARITSFSTDGATSDRKIVSDCAEPRLTDSVPSSESAVAEKLQLIGLWANRQPVDVVGLNVVGVGLGRTKLDVSGARLTLGC